jgi:hypothetical protein
LIDRQRGDDAVAVGYSVQAFSFTFGDKHMCLVYAIVAVANEFRRL